MRKTWLETSDSKLTEVNKINNNVDMIRDMRQRIGQFCRYTFSISADQSKTKRLNEKMLHEIFID